MQFGGRDDKFMVWWWFYWEWSWRWWLVFCLCFMQKEDWEGAWVVRWGRKDVDEGEIKWSEVWRVFLVFSLFLQLESFMKIDGHWKRKKRAFSYWGSVGPLFHIWVWFFVLLMIGGFTNVRARASSPVVTHPERGGL